MLVWLRSPGGSTATAAAVAAFLGLFWFAPWSKPLPFLPAGWWSTAETPVAVMSPPSTPPVGAVNDSPKVETPHPVPTPQTAALVDADGSNPHADQPGQSSGAAAGPAAATAPDFDVVRIERTGSAIVAGRGEPGTEVSLLDGGKVIAKILVDESGQFALLPPDLGEGSHYLTLQSARPGRTPVLSVRGVAVAVAKDGAAKPMVAILSPDKPVQVLSDGAANNPASPGSTSMLASAPPNATPLPVSIQAVEASLGGKFTASGVAKAGSQCRLYLNGAFLANVTTGSDGHWSVRVEKGMRPGKYTVRADELEPVSGKVVNRAEVPFDYPANFVTGRAKQLLLSRVAPLPSNVKTAGGNHLAIAPAGRVADNSSLSRLETRTDAGGTPTADGKMVVGAVDQAAASPGRDAAVVPDLQTAKVIRGDSLWRISRKLLGSGGAYTQIYASNNGQIRDPRLIYPGQILVVPSRPAN